METLISRFKNTRDRLLIRIMAYSKLDNPAAEPVSNLMRCLQDHLKKDDEIAFPLLNGLYSAMENGDYAIEHVTNNLGNETKLQDAFETICLEHREIKKHIVAARNASLDVQLSDLTDLLNKLSDYIEFEESTLYPVAKTLAYVIISRSNRIVLDPCSIPIDRPPQPSEFMFGIP